MLKITGNVPKKYLVGIGVLAAVTALYFVGSRISKRQLFPKVESTSAENSSNSPTNPLQITEMRKREYPGSSIKIEQELDPGVNYRQYIASYKSDRFKIYALLTVPEGEPPGNGFPVIIFNHGYIPPIQYQTTERYVAYVGYFARNGYIVFKPDYRGHGNSEGEPEGAYFSPAYTVDILNALSSLKKLSQANPEKIGMWGHSLGGNILLRAMVVSKDIKAGVIWAGVTGSYDDILNQWHKGFSHPPPQEYAAHRRGSDDLLKHFGSLSQDPSFWNSISPLNFVSDISGPIQLHHGLADTEVPVSFAKRLKKALKEAGKKVEFYTYEGGDHNLSSPDFEVAMARSLEFFDRYLKAK